MPYKISRRAYAETYGPTKGDRLRLADTDLILEVEQDHTVYGDEVKFGGGKVIRDGMGQSQQTRDNQVVDTVLALDAGDPAFDGLFFDAGTSFMRAVSECVSE